MSPQGTVGAPLVVKPVLRSMSTQTSAPSFSLQDTTSATQLVVLLSRVLSLCTPASPSATLPQVAKITSEVLNVNIPLDDLSRYCTAVTAPLPCSSATSVATAVSVRADPSELLSTVLESSSVRFPSVTLLPPVSYEDRDFDPSPILGRQCPRSSVVPSSAADAASAAIAAAAAATTAVTPCVASTSVSSSRITGNSHSAQGGSSSRGRPSVTTRRGSQRTSFQCPQRKN